MKKCLFTLIFIISGVVFSQNKTVSSKELNKKEQSQQNLELQKKLTYKTNTLTKELNLDEAQQKQVYNILLSQAEKNQKAQNAFKKQYATDKNLNKKEAKAKIKDLELENYKSINSSFKKNFSEKQWSQYEALLSQEKRAKSQNKLKN